MSGIEAVVYAALELSRSGWLVAVLRPGEPRPSRYKVEAGGRDRLLALLARAKAAVEQRMKAPVRVCCCYEAGYEGFWLHRALTAAGVECHVVDPSSLQVNRRARRAKSDGIDVETILRALVAWDGGEHGRAAMVMVPTPEIEDDRRVSRERDRLVREQTRHVNRIKGLLASEGIFGFEPRLAGAAERLAGLVTGDGRPLPPHLCEALRREFVRLALVAEQIGAVERVRDACRPRGRPRKDAARPAPAPESTPGRVAALKKLRGIGPEIASVLAREVFWRDFHNRRQLGSYCGLDPSPFASGDTHREQGISKAGNTRARHVLTEAAWLWLEHQPESTLARWWRERVGAAKGRVRRLMIVALARKLVIALWRYLKTGSPPQGALLAAWRVGRPHHRPAHPAGAAGDRARALGFPARFTE
jgi:transposase